VQTAFDINNRFVFVGELARLFIGKAFRQREFAGDLLIMGEILLIAGDVMIAISCWRPSAVGPMSTSFMRSDSEASFFQ
jgi:hypothetical protein